MSAGRRSILAFSAACLWLLLAAAPPQGQDTSHAPSTVERKNRAPVSREILHVKLPKPIEAKLKNGLTVLILEDRRAPYVTMQLYLTGAGALFEPPSMAGLAQATTARSARASVFTAGPPWCARVERSRRSSTGAWRDRP